MKSILSVLLVLMCLVSCSTPVQQVVKLAGKNGAELQKVLDHFEKDSCKQKYEAAQFLIRNMVGHFSGDTSHLSLYRPYLSAACSLLQAHDMDNQLLRKEINESWIDFKVNVGVGSRSSNYEADCNVISAEYLINDIDLAYQSWMNNPYNTDGSFQEFLEYVLPYRRKNGLPIENWRAHFSLLKKTHFKTCYPLPLLKACDTLLYEFRELKHNQYLLSDYPLVKVEDFERLKRGFCEHKCWYNSMLFASLGISCAIDFVPAWGHSHAGHSWNVIIANDTSYAFEPFWDKERWKYKRIYNNETWDGEWGKFRLPKVYRHTYSSNPDGPICDSRVNPSDIPALFKNFKKKDVSNEYFEIRDVTVELSQPLPDETYYGYLCVFGCHQWHPVQWGRIKEGKVTFKGMGKDIVYLPCFYKSGQLTEAAIPFLLTSEGKIVALDAKDKTLQEVAVNRITSPGAMNHQKKSALSGCCFRISKDEDFSVDEVVHVVPDTLLAATNTVSLNRSIEGRYARLMLSHGQINIAEVGFYERNMEGRLERLQCKPYGINKLKKEDVLKAVDGMSVTSMNEEMPEVQSGMNWLGFDFGRKVCIDALSYCPELKSQIREGIDFELFYWDHGWKSLGKREGRAGGYIIYKDVPENALLKLKNKKMRERAYERIFIYKNGEQIWY
ncbi:MAG: hypothetical protein JEZ14_14100 [Marinilabiliaceae bacterium]|nr:hypothetical protein [Marinilabiliaceae bacterium]